MTESYFMSCVRRAAAVSVDLHNAIVALPERFGDTEQHADALTLVKRLTGPEQRGRDLLLG
jgi:hypothetical protein